MAKSELLKVNSSSKWVPQELQVNMVKTSFFLRHTGHGVPSWHVVEMIMTAFLCIRLLLAEITHVEGAN